MNDHLSPHTQLTLGSDRTATLVDDGGHVRQTQAEASHVVALTRGDAVEAVEDALQLMLLHPDPIILDGDADLAVFVSGTDR